MNTFEKIDKSRDDAASISINTDFKSNIKTRPPKNMHSNARIKIEINEIKSKL